MKKLDHDEIRKSWLKHAPAEAKLWLAHIDAKAAGISASYQEGRAPIFEEAELLFNISAFLNWLAHIDLREAKAVRESGHPEDKDMISWLVKVTDWPRDPCEAFWFCIRNPIMHTGRSSIFSDLDRKSSSKMKLFAGFHPDLNFDPLQFQPEEFKPTEQDDGYFAFADPFARDRLNVNFYYAGVRRKLDAALTATIEGIRTADKDSLTSLSKVNRKLLAFRVVGQDDD